MKKSKRYQNRKKKQSKIRYQLKAGNPIMNVFRPAPAPTPESTVQEIVRLSNNHDFTFNNVYEISAHLRPEQPLLNRAGVPMRLSTETNLLYCSRILGTASYSRF